MSKYVKLILMILLVVGFISVSEREVLYVEGKYIGTGQGNHSQIKVEVIVNKYEIKKIRIMEQEETPGLCDIVYDEIPKNIIKANNPEVDVISGASYTSQGLIDAIKDAVYKAKLKDI